MVLVEYGNFEISSREILPVAFPGDTKKPLAVSRKEAFGADTIVPCATLFAWFGHFIVSSIVEIFRDDCFPSKALVTFGTQYTPSFPNGKNVVRISAGSPPGKL